MTLDLKTVEDHKLFKYSHFNILAVLRRSGTGSDHRRIALPRSRPPIGRTGRHALALGTRTARRRILNLRLRYRTEGAWRFRRRSDVRSTRPLRRGGVVVDRCGGGIRIRTAAGAVSFFAATHAIRLLVRLGLRSETISVSAEGHPFSSGG